VSCGTGAVEHSIERRRVGYSAALRLGERTRIGGESFFVITFARSRKSQASRSASGGTHSAGHTLPLLRATGAELKVMQELMRHSTIRVTLDTYTQAVTSEKRAAQTAVVSLFVRNRKRGKAS
jgi:integrase